MRNTDEEIERAAERFQRLAEDLDPTQQQADDLADLAAIAAAAEATRADHARLGEAVDRARSCGRSWNDIAIALGVSRQAARQRFTRPGRRAVM